MPTPPSRRRAATAPSTLSQVAGVNSSAPRDRKSTRLNSSHLVISYAVFCLKKKKTKISVPYYEFVPPRNHKPHNRLYISLGYPAADLADNMWLLTCNINLVTPKLCPAYITY